MQTSANKLSVLLSMVSGETGVSSSLLVDDLVFCELVREFINQGDLLTVAADLVNYVNQNY